jgi:hypothetical protein
MISRSSTRTVSVIAVVVLLITQMVGAAAAVPLVGDSTEGSNDVISYGSNAVPSFVITFSNGSYADVASWTSDSDVRELQSLSNETNTAVVSTPQWDAYGIGLSLDRLPTSGAAAMTYLNSERLEALGWVESVGLNYNLSLDPVDDPINASAYSPPSRWGGLSSFDVPTGGIAFADGANRTTMAESRAALGADNTTASSEGYDRPLAIIDTGANRANGDVFQGRIQPESKNTITNETVADEGYSAIADGSGHGTWVAASAAGDPAGTVHDGIAPNAELLIMKALADDGSGSTADIVQAIRYSADQDAAVISMSLGTTLYSTALEDAVQYAEDQGSLVVAAAGNSRLTRSPGIGSPGDIEGVVAVGATTGDEPTNAKSAYFSQYSGGQVRDGNIANDETVDVAAPGFKTVARTPTEGGAVVNTTLSGTSMATPMVGAGAYLTRAQNSDLSVSDARTRVQEATRPVPAAGTREVGGGMFAVDYALDGTEGDSQSGRMSDTAVTRNEVYGQVGGSGWFESLGGLLGSAA